MRIEQVEVLSLPELRGRTVVVEAPPGQRRRALLQSVVEQAGPGAHAHLLPCDMEQAGVWAGLQELLRSLLPRLEAEAPDLVERHHYELGLILPDARRKQWAQKANLTDSAPVTERVRSYPMDRAWRILHGCVDLLIAWNERISAGPWVLICEDADKAGALVGRFFAELTRRRTGRLEVTLVLAVAPGRADAVLARMKEDASLLHFRVDLPPEAPPRVDPDEMERQALALEERLQRGANAEMHVPRLIAFWRHSRTPERALKWHAMALALYNHHGFYEDALTYAQPLLADLDGAITANGSFSRWDIVSGLFNALVAVGQVERAHDLVLHEALEKTEDPNDLVSICYSMAMLHARFLKRPDFDEAEAYLARGREAIARSTFPDDEKHFLTVFNINGLALIRHRQGRADEAVRLCQEGFEHLERHLHLERHRLHRSVLLYNIAQVNMSNRSYAEAVRNYTAAIEMDPNYSEYFNERGSVFLRMGRFEEAVADYRHAIELSPPYREVWTNLGQAYRQMGRWEDAAAAYSKALELDPSQVLPWLGRAQAHEALEKTHEALCDYATALNLDPEQPLAWSNRAVLHYESGQLTAAVADLGEAIARAPAQADLYQNRAVALADLGRLGEARDDLRRYLELSPAAEDRVEVEAHLAALESQLLPGAMARA